MFDNKAFYSPRMQFHFFVCCLATPRPTLGHYQVDSLIHPMLITALFKFRPKGHQEPRNEVVSIKPLESLAMIVPGTFRFYHKALTHQAILLSSNSTHDPIQQISTGRKHYQKL